MKRRDLVRLGSLSAGGIIIPTSISRLGSPSVAAENSAPNHDHSTTYEFQSDLIASAPFVYTVKVDVSAFVGGTLRVDFWNYQQTSNDQIASFSAAFGGAVVGIANTWGTAWFNYDVTSIADSQWSARIQANFAAVGVNVNFWGLQGEVIGQLAAGGIGAIAGVVGGQGSFY